MRVGCTAIYATAAVQIHAGNDERNTVFCAAVGFERPSANGVKIGHRIKQLDFCVHFAQTITAVGSQSYASDAAYVDIGRRGIDFRRTIERMAVGRCADRYRDYLPFLVHA